jgi:hypothetical protein
MPGVAAVALETKPLLADGAATARLDPENELRRQGYRKLLSGWRTRRALETGGGDRNRSGEVRAA